MRYATVAGPEEAGALVAELVLDAYVASAPRPFLLGCPAGRTPTTTYAALGERAAARQVNLGRLVVVLMDEYLVDGALAPRDAHFSCRRYIDEHLIPHIGERPVRCPDPANPSAYDGLQVDMFLLASGARDGHVAFNPPGTAIDSPTRIIELADTTRHDNLATFPGFASIDEVPRFGVSVGLGAMTRARRAVLLLLGEDKATSLARVRALDGFDPAWPASVIHSCADPLVVADASATRFRPG